MIFDNQVLKPSFTEKDLSGQEVGLIEFLGQFGLISMKMKPGKLHVLGGVMSPLPYTNKYAESFNIQTKYRTLHVNVVHDLNSGSMLGPVYKTLKLIEDDVSVTKLSERKGVILKDYSIIDEKLNYLGKLCFPQQSVKDMVMLGHDSCTGWHFSSS